MDRDPYTVAATGVVVGSWCGLVACSSTVLSIPSD